MNTEAVTIRLDSSWDGLDVVVFWKNSVIEEPVTRQLDDPAQPHTIPWEILSEIGDLRMGLVGLDGGETVKPTIWLLYGYVVEGVDPDVGSGSQPPTPNYLQQMVEQATAAANAANAAKEASEEAAKSAGAAGPFAEEASRAAAAAKEYQGAAATSAQEAGNARDQANTAANAAEGHASAAGTAKEAAERAAEMAGNTQSEAAQSAQAAANSAQAAERAKQEAQNAAAAFPAPSKEFAGMVPVVNPAGNGYVFGKAGGGRPSVPQTPQIDYTLQEDSQIVYFDELDGSPLSGYGFTYARIVVANSPQSENKTIEGYCAINLPGAQISSQLSMGSQFVWANSQKYFTGWFDTKTGQAISVSTSASLAWRNGMSSMIGLNHPGETIKSIGIRSPTAAIPFPEGTNVKVWFA